MRNLFVYILASLFLFVAGRSYAAELKNYSKSTPNFSLRYPSEWKLTEQSNPVKLKWEMPANPGSDKIATIILVTDDFSNSPTTPPLQDYAKSKIEKAWDTFDELTSTEETETFVRTRQVQQNMFTAKRSGESLRIKSFVFIVNRVGYTLAYVAPQGSYGTYTEEFMALARSLRFDNESTFD